MSKQVILNEVGDLGLGLYPINEDLKKDESKKDKNQEKK